MRSCFQGSETYIFNCNRWLAKNEDDGAIVRELVADKVRDEIVCKDGTVKTREKERRDTLMGQLSVASSSYFDCNKSSPIISQMLRGYNISLHACIQ